MILFYILNFTIFLIANANTPTSYIVGLAYFELGDKYVNVTMSATIPNNTALIITLFDAYSRHNSASINIAGPGRKNIKIIIWATFQDPLYFSTNLVHKRVSYAGYDRAAVNKLAKNEFGKEADVIFSSFTSPVDINVFYYANTPTSYIVGLAYYQLGDKYVNVIMPATIPSNTALIITLHQAYHTRSWRHNNAAINIAGPGRKNIKIIIWATFRDQLFFSSNLVHKRISYAGYNRAAVNKVAKNEFCKEANVIYSSYRSPVNISVFYSGGPVSCQGQILPSNFTFDYNSSPRVNIVLCGIPQPTVEGEFIGQKLNIINMTIDSYKHNYTLQLPRLTQISCGKELTVKTIGCNGVIAYKTKVFVKNFIPEKVTIDTFSQNDDPVGCNGTRRVQWQLINVGSCSVEYTIQFKSSTDDVIGTVKKIKNKTFFYCTNDFDNARLVIMWATYKGTQGIKSEAKLLTPSPEPTSSTTTTISTTTTYKVLPEKVKSEVKIITAAPEPTTSATTTISIATTHQENRGETQGRKTGSDNKTTIIIVVVVLLVSFIIAIVAIIIIRGKKNKGGNVKSEKRTDEKHYSGRNKSEQYEMPTEALQYTEIGDSTKARLESKFINLESMKEMDLDNQTSNCVNQQQNYVNQPLFYINPGNSETSHYAALQDGGWTKNYYQHLQGMDQRNCPRESLNQANSISQEDYQVASDYMSMHNASYVNSNNLPYMNVGDEVLKSSHYVNQQINRTNKPSSYINLKESQIGSYAALQHTDLSKNNYEQLKLNL